MAYKITKNFTLEEMTKTSQLYSNVPSNVAVVNLCRLCFYVLQPLRDAYGKAITVSSAFRSAAVNKAVGGASTSQHLLGEASDLTTGTKEGNKRLFDLCLSQGLPFDQLIDEKNYSWIHVSYSDRNRRQVLHL